ncbi:glycosyltransferase [Leptolyngbya sp. BC1307]|uniref:glycosyltransferase family protein n=1 Tax=Leptolyngbya sp. BC1307 TaxID=2029589 RepID=UPI000EFB7678|nr:glycosyltransferase [Leptolyngbya sp. BC1307]
MLPRPHQRHQSNASKDRKSPLVPLPKNIYKSYLYGSFRDLKAFTISIAKALILLREILREDVDFVYVRAAFLDPLPFFLYILKIPCFIEANGLQFEGRQKYYSSLLVPVNRWIERLTYSIAQHVFFVGSYGDYWQLKSKNWSNVENGVESDFLKSFSECEKVFSGKVHIALIARLMAHHQPQLLIDSIKELDPTTRSKLCLHLIGSGLETIRDELHTCMDVVDHGFLNRDELAENLKQIHVGLIPGVPKYQSQMKLFDYGAAKCVVLVPKVHNFQRWFNESEIEFFEPEDAKSLSRTITDLANDPSRFIQKGDRLHQRIAQDFTWDKIFAAKAKIIKNCLAAK